MEKQWKKERERGETEKGKKQGVKHEKKGGEKVKKVKMRK